MDAALLEARLRAFYLRHNAGNEQNIAEIVRKFAGREAELSAKLRRKYGAAPDFSLPEAETREDGADAALYRRDFKPYELKESAGGPMDLRSPDFDPLRALAARDVKLPVPGTFPLDNIQKCRALLPESDPHRQVVQARPKKASAEADSKRSAASRSSVDTAARRDPTLFEALADTYLDGPFTLLRRCFLEHKRVHVVVRRVNSVRGTCSGLLKAFDKHMNMLLMDVTHEFVPFADHERILREVREGVRSSTSAVLSSSSRSHNRRMGIPVRREYHRQLFLRGDNVVSVSYLPPAAPPGGERARARR